MRAVAWLHHQVADLLTDFVIAGLAAILPMSWANRLLWRVASIQWLFPGTGPAIRHSETLCFDAPVDLPRQWAWTTLMEAAQAWRLMLGLHPRLNTRGKWPEHSGFIAAGMHYGAGISALWHLRQSGLRPRFVFRPVAGTDLPGRPVKLAWYRLRTRLIMRLCPDGPITTGGAGRRILEVLDEARSTPVVLFDTPVNANSGWQLRVGRAHINLRSGGARLFSKSNGKVVFFVVTIDPETGQHELSISPVTSGAESMDELMSLMETSMQRHPGQWLLWHSVPGLFTSSPGQSESKAAR